MAGFSYKDVALRSQKKLLSNVASKSVVQLFIDDTSSEILDQFYHVSKIHSGNKEEAKKVVKDLVKVVVKVGVLFRHQAFSPEEMALALEFKKKIHQGAMTAISFHEVEFTFDMAVMEELLNGCQDLLLRLVEKHLTAKSHGRIRHVFSHYADPGLLTHLFDPQGALWPCLARICTGLNLLMEEGKL
ncbi:tumor necrosis factor alpha-induced protein 8-like protein 2 [Osmerus eperlanus]|uniref:tumor necrosis factor alpha-induced protein 8-like protein 2 n=1 Tax=Osmerus eperlanus TaxID=29151 RepID=UPI002E0D1A50